VTHSLSLTLADGCCTTTETTTATTVDLQHPCQGWQQWRYCQCCSIASEQVAVPPCSLVRQPNTSPGLFHSYAMFTTAGMKPPSAHTALKINNTTYAWQRTPTGCPAPGHTMLSRMCLSMCTTNPLALNCLPRTNHYTQQSHQLLHTASMHCPGMHSTTLCCCRCTLLPPFTPKPPTLPCPLRPVRRQAATPWGKALQNCKKSNRAVLRNQPLGAQSTSSCSVSSPTSTSPRPPLVAPATAAADRVAPAALPLPTAAADLAPPIPPA
jgi:hypothetical protein